jgi:hypothetical protein
MYQKMPIPGRKTTLTKILSLLLIIAPSFTYGWGFAAHKLINNTAVYTLPPQLFKFYKIHIETITEKAVNADMRRYIAEDEACKHYLDADHYEKSYPLDTIPHFWKDAIIKFSNDTLNAYGIAPWNLQLIKYQLTKAFESKDLYKILKLSADLGHYAADLHVPLHSTENYNGQLTGQEGIHSLWESRVYELFNNEYDFFVGRASYISDVNLLIWERFSQSFAALDSVLLFEKVASEKFPNRFILKSNGRNTSKIYNEEFCFFYHQLLNGMVERRARLSIDLIGSLWFTAWIDAGQPDLNTLVDNTQNTEEENDKNFIQRLIDKGKMIGRKEE